MSKRPRQWPPLPGPVPDKRVVAAMRFGTKEAPMARILGDDGWITIGWLDEISTAGDAAWAIGNNHVHTTTSTASQSFADVMRVADTAGFTSEKERGYLDRISALTREKVSAEKLIEDQSRDIEFLRGAVHREVQARQELGSWLAGVQPVEDSEIPGLYLCGVCHRPLGPHRAHREGCPMEMEAT